MSEFKIGDKVRYTYDSRFPFSMDALKFGKIYTVKDVYEKHILLERHGWYLAKYFQHVDQYRKSADLPKYVVVQGNVQDVVAEVEQYLKQGYKLQGGVSMHQDWFAQAMILGG